MDAVVRVHRPTLTQEEREYRMAKLKEATTEYWREVIKIKGEKENV